MADSASSVESVLSNDDLLTEEILVRLPALKLVLFKSVSKRWRSLINANLTFRRKLDPVAGLFLRKSYWSFSYDFVPLDIRIPLVTTNFNFGTDLLGDFDILHSCNGLLLCRTDTDKLYVNNPSITDMFKVLPQPEKVNFTYGCFALAFDPTESLHYKVILSTKVDDTAQIHIYSSKTGNWSLCDQFPLLYFEDAVYLNDAIYWPINDQILKLNIKNEHLVLTAQRISSTVFRNVNYECRLLESGGCLLLVGKGNVRSRHFTIYEKRSEYSEWTRKYIINVDNIIKPPPKRWGIWRILFCNFLGEREKDYFLVMEIDNKVVKYKIVSKTLSTISNLGPDEDLA